MLIVASSQPVWVLSAEMLGGAGGLFAAGCEAPDGPWLDTYMDDPEQLVILNSAYCHFFCCVQVWVVEVFS